MEGWKRKMGKLKKVKSEEKVKDMKKENEKGEMRNEN